MKTRVRTSIAVLFPLRATLEWRLMQNHDR